MKETRRHRNKKIEEEEQKTGSSGEVGLDTEGGGARDEGKKKEKKEGEVRRMKVRNDGRRKLIAYSTFYRIIFLFLLPFSLYRKMTK